MLPIHHGHMRERLCLYTVLSTSVSMMVHNDSILAEYDSIDNSVTACLIRKLGHSWQN
jgi:hypothetical protein